MLRNDLINLVAERDNDPVAVSVNGTLIDVDSVGYQGGRLVLVLDPDGLRDVLRQIAPRGPEVDAATVRRPSVPIPHDDVPTPQPDDV